MSDRKWSRSCYGRYVSGPHAIERSSNPRSLRVWYVVDGPHAYGVGLSTGMNGGFFKLVAAKAAIEAAESSK